MALKLVNARTVDQWVELIQAQWSDSVKGILEGGLSLSNARDELNKIDFWQMVRDRLGFAKSTVYQLIKIGTDAKLLECATAHLPAYWRTLHALACLTDEQFQRGIDSGVIHAGMERKDVAQLKPPKEKPLPPPVLTGRALIERRTQECRGQIAQTLRECSNQAEQSEFLALIRLQLNDLETRMMRGAA